MATTAKSSKSSEEQLSGDKQANIRRTSRFRISVVSHEDKSSMGASLGILLAYILKSDIR
jgi:hypothetical protein